MASHEGGQQINRADGPDGADRIAIVLGALILMAVFLDVLIYGNEHVIFLGKKMLEFIEWIAFWR